MGLFGTNNTAPHNNNNSHNGIFQNEPRRVSTQSGPRRNDDYAESKHHPVAYGQEARHDSVVTGRSYLKRPTFGDWIKHNWMDVLTLAAFGGLALGVYFLRPTPTRDFPINFQDGEIVNPEFAYPHRRHIIPIWAAACIGVLVPMFVVLIMQYRIKSFWDCNNAFFGILYSVITAALIQVVLKCLIGGVSPNFLEICNPILPPRPNGDNVGRGFRMIYYNSSICTGDPFQISRALESFPCGGTTAAFAGLVFLSLYLNAKLKVMSNYHPAMWKLIAVLAPILGAVLIASTNTIDRHHHWYDCVAGALIGTLTAFISYRMVYAAIWDFRFNHIPQNRTVPCPYGLPQTELAKTCFTHQAGWDEGTGTFGGAPCDSSSTEKTHVLPLHNARAVDRTTDASAHGHPPTYAGPVNRPQDLEQGTGPSVVSNGRPANPIPASAGGARSTPTPTVTVEEVPTQGSRL